MRKAIFSALLASLAVSGLAAQAPTQSTQQQAPPQSAPAKHQPAQPDTKQADTRKESQTPAQPQSISPLIPVPTPADGAAPAADPSRIGASPEAGAPKISAGVDTKSYVIGADDELSINVFENPGFNIQIQAVRPDGVITMPLIGDVHAAGKTPEQLKKEITDVLSQNYMNLPPHVSVTVVRVLSKNYYINGEVLKPGKYPLTVPTTVMQALVNAGGFKDFANKKKIRIQRGSQFFTFNYNEVSKGKRLEQNIQLLPDDQIFVN